MAPELAEFPMQSATLQEWVVFNLFQTTRSADALLVAGGNVAGGRTAFGFGFRAFEDDDIARHK